MDVGESGCMAESGHGVGSIGKCKSGCVTVGKLGMIWVERMVEYRGE